MAENKLVTMQVHCVLTAMEREGLKPSNLVDEIAEALNIAKVNADAL